MAIEVFEEAEEEEGGMRVSFHDCHGGLYVLMTNQKYIHCNDNLTQATMDQSQRYCLTSAVYNLALSTAKLGSFRHILFQRAFHI